MSCLRREWGGQGLLKDVYSNVLVMTLAYVITAGAFCEWCWVAKNAAWVSCTALQHHNIQCQYLCLWYDSMPFSLEVSKSFN